MEGRSASREMKPVAIEISSGAIIAVIGVLDECSVEDGGCFTGGCDAIEAWFHYYKVDNSIMDIFYSNFALYRMKSY